MAVTNNATLVTDHETAPTYTSIGSGQGAAQDSDFFFLGSNASSRRMDNVTYPAGFWFVTASTYDMSASGTHFKVYVAITTNTFLNDFGVRIGSTTSAYEEHNTGTVFYPTATGGWVPLWVEVDAGTDSGSPAFASADTFAVVCGMGNIASNLKNLVTDQAHFSTRPVFLWDGSTGDLDDFITTEDTAGVGSLVKSNGIYTCYANFAVGSATATTFDASGQTIAFPDASWLPAASTWMGIDIDLQNASTDIDFSGASILSGNPTGASARKPDLITTGTNGVSNFQTAKLSGLRIIDFTSGIDARGANISDSGRVAIAAEGTTGADMRNSSILTSAVAADESAAIWDVNADTDGKLDGMTFSKGANAHHAIEYGTTAPLSTTLRNVTTTGFNATDGQNDSTLYFADRGSDVTWEVSVIGGTGEFSFKKERAGDTVNITLDPASITVTVSDSSGAVEGAAVYIETTTAVVILDAETNASGVATTTYSGSLPVTIDSDVSGVKSSSGATPYAYFTLTGTISGDFSADVLLSED